MQDILKLKAAAINTVSGVNMTTRRNLLKIKVYSRVMSPVVYLVSTSARECQKRKSRRLKSVRPHIFDPLALTGPCIYH